jgi:hypothetical protein
MNAVRELLRFAGGALMMEHIMKAMYREQWWHIFLRNYYYYYYYVKERRNQDD